MLYFKTYQMKNIEVAGGFLVLHDKFDDSEIFVQEDEVSSIKEETGPPGSTVEMVDNSTYHVKELPRDIIKAIQQDCEARFQ